MKKYHMLRVRMDIWEALEARATEQIGVDAPDLAKQFILNGINGAKTPTNKGPAKEKEKKQVLNNDINKNKIWYENLENRKLEWLTRKKDKDFFILHIIDPIRRYDEARVNELLRKLSYDKTYEPSIEEYQDLVETKEELDALKIEAAEALNPPQVITSHMDPESAEALKEHNAKIEAEMDRLQGKGDA